MANHNEGVTMPKKPEKANDDEVSTTQTKLAIQRLEGQAALYMELARQLKVGDSQRKEINAQLKAAIESHGKKTADGLKRTIILPSGTSLEIRYRNTESFDQQAAMDLLNSLDPKVAAKYYVQSTDENQIASAFHNDDITMEQMKACLVPGEQAALYVTPKESDK